jgi:hypothetical protein
LKEGIKCLRNIEQTNKDFRGWVKLIPKTYRGQGRLISFKNTRGLIASKTQKPQGGWLNYT